MYDIIINIPIYIDVILFIISIILIVAYFIIKIKKSLNFNIISLESMFYIIGVGIFSCALFFCLKILISPIFIFFAESKVSYFDCEIVGGTYGKNGSSIDYKFNNHRYTKMDIINEEALKDNKNYEVELGLRKTLLNAYYINSFKIRKKVEKTNNDKD
jgi:hypothetical protein